MEELNEELGFDDLQSASKVPLFMVLLVDAAAVAIWFASLSIHRPSMATFSMFALIPIFFAISLLQIHMDFSRIKTDLGPGAHALKLKLGQRIAIIEANFQARMWGLFAGKYLRTLIIAALAPLLIRSLQFSVYTPVALIFSTLVSTLCWPIGGRYGLRQLAFVIRSGRSDLLDSPGQP